VQYIIVEAATSVKLVGLVTTYIREGFRLLGGVSTSISHDAHGGSYQVFAQAMTKEAVL